MPACTPRRTLGSEGLSELARAARSAARAKRPGATRRLSAGESIPGEPKRPAQTGVDRRPGPRAERPDTVGILGRVSAQSAEGATAELEIGPPERLAVGRGNAFVAAGHCYHPTRPVRGVSISVGGAEQPVSHARMPRGDVFDRASANGSSARFAFRSGFVAIPSVPTIDAELDADVSVVLDLEGGGSAEAQVGRLRLEPGLTPPSVEREPAWSGAGPKVAICMATYNPPPDLLRRQLGSIREQTHDNWVCLISDDRSDPAARRLLESEIGDDPRFAISPSERRLGFYRNFERAMSMAPADADFVALCDQDDRWHPDKLQRLLASIASGAELVYSDARVVRPSGEVAHDSYWTNRRNNHTNFASLLMANCVTGAASLFRRSLLDDALPFPPALANPFHDHWLAVVALARGEIGYIDEPLYDYVQHGDAVIGHDTANRKPGRIRKRLVARLRNPGDGSRVVYYYNWQQQLLFAEVLRLRCWDRMSRRKRRALTRLLAADDGLVSLGWLLGRPVRKAWGRNETLDREFFYAYALLRRRAVTVWNLGASAPRRVLPRDAAIPPPREPGEPTLPLPGDDA